eukprot:2358448-Pyramimonas_sp.AAC.1
MNNALKTWHRRKMSFETSPISTDNDFPSAICRRKYIRPYARSVRSGRLPTRWQEHLRKGMMPLRSVLSLLRAAALQRSMA